MWGEPEWDMCRWWLTLHRMSDEQDFNYSHFKVDTLSYAQHRNWVDRLAGADTHMVFCTLCTDLAHHAYMCTCAQQDRWLYAWTAESILVTTDKCHEGPKYSKLLLWCSHFHYCLTLIILLLANIQWNFWASREFCCQYCWAKNLPHHFRFWWTDGMERWKQWFHLCCHG